MKIEKLETKYADLLGDAEIHLNKAGEFSLNLKDPIPEDYKYDQLPTSNSLVEMRKMVAEFCENCIRQKLVSKKIFISIATSSETTPYDRDPKHNEMFDNDKWKLFGNGDGLSITYMVVNVYNYKYKTIVAHSKEYIKNRTVTQDPIYGWKDKHLYETIGGNNRKFNNPGVIRERRDVLFGFYPTHEMEYDETIIAFLENITSSMRKMVDNVMNFFNVPVEQLQQKVLTYDSNHKLLSQPTHE